MQYKTAAAWAPGILFALGAWCCIDVAQATVLQDLSAEPELGAKSSLERHAPGKSFAASWQITRARFQNAQSATQTESFQETWLLTRRGDDDFMLVSPRAKIPVRLRTAQSIGSVPSKAWQVLISDADFARLIGVAMPAGAGGELAKPGKRMIRLSLENGEVQGNDVVLYASDDEHLAVHLERTR